jgi:ABC-2 type transport system permease protein
MIGRVWRIARQELRGYFDQPTAYVLLVAFLALSLFLLFRTMYASAVASLRPMFDLLPVLFAVFVPAATMRSLAEERRGGTLEWLLAQPVTETEVVLGKFLGDWLFVLVALAGTIPTAIGVLLASSADAGIVVAQYVGAAFLAAQLVALGIWASSFTRNQITAFIVAASLSFLLFLIGIPVVQIGLPPTLSGALARLSVVGHFQNVARGVVDLRDVLYFASFTALFLVLAVGAVARDRLSHEGADLRRMKLGAGVVALLVLVVNLAGSHVRGRLDLTRDNLYTLADGTREILGGLDDLVQVKLFASAELPPEIQLQLRDVRDLLADMTSAADGNLILTDVNPDDDTEAADEASSFGIYPVEFNVLRDDEFQVRRGYYGLAVAYADEQEVLPVIERVDDLEFRLASAIASMTSEERQGIAFVQGFGAKGAFEIPGLRESLADRYGLRSVDLVADSAASLDRDSTTVVVIAAPTEPVDSAVVARVRAFVQAGGAALVLLEPIRLDPQSPMPLPVRSGLAPLLEDRGLSFSTELVFDLASSERVSLGRRGFFNVVVPYPLWPVALPAGDHAITRGLSSLSLGWAGALEIADSAHATPLWQTTEAGGLQAPDMPIFPDQDWDRPAEELGVRTVAVAVEPREGSGEGRLIVVGDGSFAEGQFVQSNPGNLAFLANAIDWLAQDEALMSIRAKDRTPPALVLTSDATRNVLKWGNLVGVPLLFALGGLVRVNGRRRRAEARWGEIVA